jgi:hypothetical protein
MLLFTLSGCLLENTDNIVSVEYYGSNSFRLGYAGVWEYGEFEMLYIHNNAGTTYHITEAKQVGWATSYSTNYEIIYVYPDWIPGERITVEYAGTIITFNVPKDES